MWQTTFFFEIWLGAVKRNKKTVTQLNLNLILQQLFYNVKIIKAGRKATVPSASAVSEF